MVRLDLPQNPDRYLQLVAYTDSQGQLIVQIGNPTSVIVADLGLLIRFVDGQGAIRETNRVLNQALQPGASTRFADGHRPIRQFRRLSGGAAKSARRQELDPASISASDFLIQITDAIPISR